MNGGSIELTDVAIEQERPSPVEATALYDSVGWSSYTSDPGILGHALAHSPYVLTARRNQSLIGLLRAVGDGSTILYIQDLLVRPDMQRRSVGTRLIGRCLSDHEDVRQVVLITDHLPELVAFYEALGFSRLDDRSSLAGFYRLA